MATHDLDDFDDAGYDRYGADAVERDSYVRRVFADSVHWITAEVFHDDRSTEWRYGVARIPFVPGYHVVEYDDGYEYIRSTHSTLAEAFGLLKILLTAPGAVTYE
ncbi:MAG: hypothetical protein ACKO0Z_01880 [Betaproteobacteria bacterium]